MVTKITTLNPSRVRVRAGARVRGGYFGYFGNLTYMSLNSKPDRGYQPVTIGPVDGNRNKI